MRGFQVLQLFGPLKDLGFFERRVAYWVDKYQNHVLVAGYLPGGYAGRKVSLPEGGRLALESVYVGFLSEDGSRMFGCRLVDVLMYGRKASRRLLDQKVVLLDGWWLRYVEQGLDLFDEEKVIPRSGCNGRCLVSLLGGVGFRWDYDGAAARTRLRRESGRRRVLSGAGTRQKGMRYEIG